MANRRPVLRESMKVGKPTPASRHVQIKLSHLMSQAARLGVNWRTFSARWAGTILENSEKSAPDGLRSQVDPAAQILAAILRGEIVRERAVR